MEALAPATITDIPGNLPELQAVTFTTARLFCRRIQLSDVEDIFLIRSNPNAVKYVSYPHDTHISTTKAVMERRVSNPLYFSFAITLRTPEPSPAPKVIGSVGGTTLPEIGYGLNEAYWGKGYASEALEGFIKLYWELFPDGYPALKQERDKHRLKATTNSGNEASRGVLAKAGFKEIGDVEVYDYTGVKKIVYDGWVIERPGREGTTGGNGW